MLRQAARILLVAALMISIGLHWAVLQSAAWAGMIVRYSVQEGSLITGLSQTFDNEHPCPLCCAVRQGTQNEPKCPEKQADNEKKLVLVLMPAAPLFPHLRPHPLSGKRWSWCHWSGICALPPRRHDAAEFFALVG